MDNRTNLNRAVVTAADEAELVARNSPDALDVAKERALDLAGVDVPELDRVVEAARDEHRPLARRRGVGRRRH